MRFGMRLASSLKPTRGTSAKAVDCDNPVWAEEMLGSPIVRKGRRPLNAPTKSLTGKRFNPKVLAHLKSQDAGYRIRIIRVLEEFVASRPTRRSTGALQRRRTPVSLVVRPQRYRTSRAGRTCISHAKSASECLVSVRSDVDDAGTSVALYPATCDVSIE